MVKVNVKKFSKSKHNINNDDIPKEEISEETKEIETIEYNNNNTDDNDFLKDLHKDNYDKELQNEKDKIENEKLFKEQEKQNIKIQKEQEKQNIKLLKQFEKDNRKTISNNSNYEDNSSIFGDDSTPILGKDKHILLKKITQYKKLFPEELGKFKIKKNPTNQELQEYLDEMIILTEITTVDDFLNDSLINCIKMIEGVSSKTKYNISGLSTLLKSNKQFHQLSKQLFLKYNCFSKIPAEYQMLFLISTTAYICMNKNKNAGQLNDFLNEPIQAKEIII